MCGNFIKIDRKILNWEWWSDINTFRLFMYMLISAYWKSGNYKGRVIPRGSFPSSVSDLAKNTNLTENEIRTALKHLKSTGEITSKSTNKFTIFSVENYDFYQSLENKINEQKNKRTTNKSQTINKQLTNSILKEYKEDKNVNNNIMSISAINALFEELWLLYPRKKGKGQISDAKKRKIAEVGKEQMIRAIERYKRYVSTQKDLSYQYGSTFFNSGYIDYLDENYVEKEDKPNNTNGTRFNNFESRSYDMSSLEQQLLGRE
jgi:hypothetical protein